MTDASPSRSAIVLGAGIQGCCAALALTRAGWSVTVLDGADRPFRGTSLRGEGKLHLGYVYANATTEATARLMADGALSFSRLLDAWLPHPVAWDEVGSVPFTYGVLGSSMVPAATLAERYAVMDAALAARLADGATYVGRTTLEPVRPVADPAAAGFGPDVVAAFTTSEVALDPARLRRALTDGLAASGATVFGDTLVHGVERCPQGFVVHAEHRSPGNGPTTADRAPVEYRADVVVNCLWHGRLAVDATLGIAPGRPWSYRLKYGVHGRRPADRRPLPSATFVLGPFGDVVQHQDGTIYLSWYPACMTAWGSALTVPADWLAAMDADEPPMDLVRRTVAALAALVPDLDGFTVTSAAPGIIVARGETDIDDPASELHRRDAIGVHDHDGYLSIDTGKLTTAPLFADRLVQLLGR